MNGTQESVAFGAPGMEPRWTSSAKEGLGTSYHTSCRLWFTLSHGIINEIYYPHVDQPNTRDLQFLITDGETFCHEEKRDLDHRTEYPERDCVFYRLTNTDRNGRYRLIKHVLTDPHRSVLLIHTKVEVLDPALKGKLRLYALLAPHIDRYGAGNSGWGAEIGAQRFLCAKREKTFLAMASSSNFGKRSVGYVGSSDGWQDLMQHYDMQWQFSRADDGNIALTAEIIIPESNEFTMAVALGGSYQSTAAKVMQSLAIPFQTHRDGYVRQWQRTVVNPKFDFSKHTGDSGSMYRLSRCVLLVHEDKVFQGAIVASMSIPWGETKGDDDLGGYHLVWTRDLVQSATALLVTGQIGTPLRALIWLAALQRTDGSFPQNSWIDGSAYWKGLQLDEIAAPMLLAWRLRTHNTSLGLFDPTVMIYRGAAYLISQGPVTAQERWEENSGYSPSTLATVIAGLVCAAEFAKLSSDNATADFIFAYADWLAAHVEDWTVTNCGELVPGIPRHYVRITPADTAKPDPHPDPNTAMLCVANGGGEHPARNIVGGDFLHLVRLGIRSPQDPLIKDSIKVIDAVLKHDLPQGPCWRRYNFDGYGQKDDGSAFDGTGVGRCWPILTGERGHYELAAGNDPMPYIIAMEKFANEGGMITEQVWDGPATDHFKPGAPTGAAMPLCWSHAEYVSLVRSCNDGVCVDRVESAYQRYVANPIPSRYEFWSLRHPSRRIPAGKTLRIILTAKADVSWSTDQWTTVKKNSATYQDRLKLWFVDLPTESLSRGSIVAFTFFWSEKQTWQGQNFDVGVI